MSAGRLLVTGESGFVGSIVRATAAPGEIIGLGKVDLRDAQALAAAVREAAPGRVLHLAAQSSVHESLRDPRATYEVNVLGTLNLLQALDAARFRGRLLLVSSAEVYGQVGVESLPITEDCEAAPRSPYAASKLATEDLCRQWHRTNGLDVVIARPFNHIGPGQPPHFAVASFARQVAEIAAGRAEPRIATGDLDVTRDFTDVRDVVRAYRALLDRGVAGTIYNVCSGVERRVGSILEGLLRLAGVKAEVTTDPARLRPGEQRRVVGSAARLAQATGWTAGIDFDRTLADLLEDWKKRITA